MKTDPTIGIYNQCGQTFKPTDPRIGFICGLPVKGKDERCKGVVIRHRSNPIPDK